MVRQLRAVCLVSSGNMICRVLTYKERKEFKEGVPGVGAFHLSIPSSFFVAPPLKP